jgi:putative transcriptional regulator
MKEKTTIVRMHPDGTVFEILPDGSEQPISGQPMRPMAEEEIVAAALSDADASPMTEEQIRQAPRVPRVKTIRRALQLTQEEFAARYHIPLSTLRDWEQGDSQPDQTAQAYLRAIAVNPEAVYQALQFIPH